ncbi:MAG: TrkA family potassium uptake protein [Nanoarchaeota archaeon]|nr:TrkA family potassium uptake protein [Nanoarchaeota archaeon]MBU4493345.1 TrkA family potassium uptake protein [Nanoarchaeota archaeon]
MASPRKIVIEGIYPYGLVIAKRLANRNEDVTLVDKDEKLCDDISRSLDGILVIEGEIKKDVLNKNSITEFDVFIAASKNDGDNLISCLYVKNHYKKVDKIMSIVQDEESEEAYIKEGILTANPERAAAKRFLKYMAGDPRLTELITSAGESELMPIEIEPGSMLDGKKISTIPLHSKDYNVACVYRKKNKEGERTIIAKEDFILEAGDVLQLLTRPQYHKKLVQYIKK